MKLFLNLLNEFYFKFRLYRSSSRVMPYLMAKHFGFKIGTGCRFTGKKISFGGEPFLVSIGNNVTITPGVKFQTHDGGVGLFRKEYPGINVFGKISVGNNVFIGEDSMIMYGVTIGDNVVIGARSIVTKDIPNNSVAVGTPAKVIKSIDEYKGSSLKKAIYVFSSNPKVRKEEILAQLKR